MSSILLLPSHSPCPHHFLSAPSPGPVYQYQLYAVEKWIVQRKHNTFLVVFTGISDHAISLDAYVPDPAHDPVAAWDAAIALLRADGARPKLTAHGTLMVTSLAHFRSDYTIVHIPSGNFPQVRDQLYANINLLRMGCSGRSALTLEDPSDSTKDRFISSYRLPLPLPNTKVFVATVLELVKLVQASLAIFGMHPLASFDGLLCDDSVDGIKLWIAHVGGPCVGLEPSERIADPVFVSAIFSLVLSTRNKLAHLGYSFILPRDPFLYPHAFSLALTAYIQSTPQLASPHLIPAAPPPTTVLSAAASAAASIPLLSHNTILTRDLVQSISSAYDAKLKAESRKVRRVIKNKLAPSSTIDSDGPDPDRENPRDTRKHTLSLSLSGTEDRTPQIVGTAGPSAGVGSGTGSGGQILSGIGSLASGLRIGGTHGDPDTLMAPTLDLQAFVTFAIKVPAGSRRNRKKDRESADSGPATAVSPPAPPAGPGSVAERDGVVAGSIKALWTGRVADIIKMREDLDGPTFGSDDRRRPDNTRTKSDFDKKYSSTRWKRREHHSGLPMAVVSDGDADDHRERRNDGRSTEEESDVFVSHGHSHPFSGMWGGRMRGKLGNWAALGRRKHTSVDLSNTPPPPAHKGKERERDPSPQPPTSPRQPSRLIIGGSMSGRSSSHAPGSRTQSPLLPPIVFSADRERDPDDDDLLSSGQVSPLSDYRPSPFNVFSSSTINDNSSPSGGLPPESSSSVPNLQGSLSVQEYERTLTRLLNQKRPWANRRLTQSTRVSSWADPVSARDGEEKESEEAESGSARGQEEDERGGGLGQRSKLSFSAAGVYDEPEEELEGRESDVSHSDAKWKRKEKARFHSLLSVVDDHGVLAEELLGSSGDEGFSEDDVDEIPLMDRRKGVGVDLRRRRSFHDLDTFRGLEVLTPERMKIDVEICGQILIMYRRAEHLQNVTTTIRLLSNALSTINTTQRSHYQSHLDILSQIDHKSLILASLDVEALKSGKLLQATNTLRYEAEQFRVDDLWQAASPSRHKVFALREKVFGTGGRRLPAGVHGAHGPFNRLQWTLDGRERLVDYLGRTESEAEEESQLEHLRRHGVRVVDRPGVEDEEEEDVVAHPGIKPMWLLRFFTSWGARWSASTPVVAPPPPEGKVTEEVATEETQPLSRTAESSSTGTPAPG